MCNISEVIKLASDYRKSSGLSQKEVALKAGLTQQQVSEIEREITQPRLSTFLSYLNAFDVDLVIEKKED